jgi:hypothetical protein
MIRPICLAAALLLPALPELAAGADAICLCASEVARTTGHTLSEFDATYRQRPLQSDLVRWPGVVCEVRQGKVRALSADGTPAVNAGRASADAKPACEQRDRETSGAIRTLDTRRALLTERLRAAQRQLRLPEADIPAVTGCVQEGTGQALGRQGISARA